MKSKIYYTEQQTQLHFNSAKIFVTIFPMPKCDNPTNKIAVVHVLDTETCPPWCNWKVSLFQYDKWSIYTHENELQQIAVFSFWN